MKYDSWTDYILPSGWSSLISFLLKSGTPAVALWNEPWSWTFGVSDVFVSVYCCLILKHEDLLGMKFDQIDAGGWNLTLPRVMTPLNNVIIMINKSVEIWRTEDVAGQSYIYIYHISLTIHHKIYTFITSNLYSCVNFRCVFSTLSPSSCRKKLLKATSNLTSVEFFDFFVPPTSLAHPGVMIFGNA